MLCTLCEIQSYAEDQGRSQIPASILFQGLVLNSTLACMEWGISKYATGILENTLTIKE